MTQDYKCEELSLCENFQVAICLHCDQRLCVQHIIEHEKIVLADVKNLLNLAEETRQQIKNNSEKSKIRCDDLSPALDKWRTQQLEKLEQIYIEELIYIKDEEEDLENFHQDLIQQLEHYARQPLERVQKQQNTNKEVLNRIRETIEKVRNDGTLLKWDSSMEFSVDIQYSPSDFLLIPIIGMIDDKKQQKLSSSIPNTSSNASASSTCKVIKLKPGTPHKKLVKMFWNTLSIQQSKNDIAAYIVEKSVFVLVNAYLTAWHKKLNLSEKDFILNEHISTIQKYLNNRKSDFDVLVGIQIFFFNQKIQGNKYEIMSFLLEFFLKHQCINRNLILQWYNNNDTHGYNGFEEAKRLAEPFIKLLSTMNAMEANLI